MITNRRLCILIPLLTAIALTPRVSAAAFDGKTVLESMNVESDDIRKLEDGEVVAFSGEPYEQSKRELASDAVVLINKSLDTVLAEINEEASLIPRKVMLGYQDIGSEADFAQGPHGSLNGAVRRELREDSRCRARLPASTPRPRTP